MLLERETELDAIDGTLRGGRARRGSTLLIEGPAGIGKTTLLKSAAAQASDAGMTVLRATASEFEHDSVGLLAEAFAGYDAEVAGLQVADALPDPRRASPEAFAVADSLFWLAIEIADRGPIALILDDVQWADAISLSAIERIGTELEGTDACLLLGLRTGEAGAEQIGRRLSGLPQTETLNPRPLGAQAVRELVRRRVEDAPEDFCNRCAELSGGNPMLLTELLRALGRAGAKEPGLRQLQELRSASVEGLVGERLSRCSPGARELALAVAVLGPVANRKLIARLLGRPAEEVKGLLAELDGVELLADGEPLRFESPMLRRAAFRFDPQQVGSLRLAAAEMFANAGELARAGSQLLGEGAPAPSGEPWAHEALLAAARQAAQRGDRELALQALTLAFERATSATERRTALLDRGRLLAMSRDPSALASLTAALELAEHEDEAARISLAIGQACFYLGRLREGAAACRQRIGSLKDEPELGLLLEAEALNAERLLGGEQARPRELAALVKGAKTTGERAVLVHVAAEAVARGDCEAKSVCADALAAWADGTLLEEVGPDAPLISFLGTTLAWAEDFGTALDLCRLQLEAGRRARNPVTASYALALRAGTRLRMGDLAAAEADAETVVSELPATDPLAYMISLGWLLEALVERGRPEQALEALERSALTGELPDLGTVHFLSLARGQTRFAAGDAQAALRDYLTVGERAERAGYRNPAGMAWRSRAAEALLALGRREEAGALADEECRRAGRFGARRALGIALRARGRCAGGRQAVKLLDESVAVLSASAAGLELARSRVALGETLIEVGDVDDAVGTLREGMDQAHRCGAHPLVDEAMELLRRCGLRPRRPALRGPDALTAQQFRIATLAAEGKTNREIAEALFLERRTVELHLTGAYRKLGIESRESLVESLGPPDAK